MASELETNPSAPGGLPAHWRRGRTIAALWIALLCAFALWWLAPHARAENSDNWWLKARFRFREAVRAPRLDPEIVLVTIDDRTAERWSDTPMIGWGSRLATAIEKLDRSGAKVIALDWTQPVSLEKWFPGNDQRLAEAILASGKVVMVKELVPVPPGRPREKAHWLLPNDLILTALASYRDLGYAEIHVADAKGETEVAALTPALESPEGAEPSFSARVVERAAGVDAALTTRAWALPGQPAVRLRENQSFLVNYAPGTGRGTAFEQFSLSDVVESWISADRRVKDKIVILGVGYTGSNDQHYIPLLDGVSGSRMAYGAEIQANAVRTLLSAKPISTPDSLGRWLLSLLLALLGIGAFFRLGWVQAQVVSLAAAVGWIALAFIAFTGLDHALPVNLPLASLVVGGGMMASYRALREEVERRQVMGLWGRYQDPRLVEYLLQHPEARGGEGKEATVTVLFADLKNFTKTVENLEPGDALQMLNRYLGILSAVTIEHGGYVDKFLGDGLMAQWGAPPPQAVKAAESGVKAGVDHAELAVKACLEMERQVGELSRTLVAGAGVTFGLRLTVHTGPVVVGWVGSSRLEFTIIGDTVNVTARLQETAKELDCEFLISESTHRHVTSWIRTGKQAEVEIRGRQQPLRVFEVIGTEPLK